MKVIKTIQGPLHNNVFVVIKNKTQVLIDPGLDTEHIEKWLNDNDIIPNAILLTHGHFDHIASAKYFQDKFNCEVYIGKEDQFYLDQPYKPLFIKENMFGKINTKFKYINTLNHQIKIGAINIKMIKTPGHTPGSTCYLFNEINTIFTGDTLFKENIGRTDFEKSCLEALTNSIKTKLYTLPLNTIILPGHGICSTINNERKNNPHIKGD